MKMAAKMEACRAENQIRWQWLTLVVIITALSILGPYLVYDGGKYDTQIILHPFDMTKHLIKDRTYAIIFDAGSTGTRIHIFTFLIDHQRKSSKIVLESERFFYTKPGLSFYADNASEAALSLEGLMDKAYLIVPSLLTSRTQVLLRATAGLRLLPGDSADNILNQVEAMLRVTPFKITPQSVSMLNDLDEGVFAWYTVNFLYHRLHNISESIATLDLGGGSTQVTFSTNNIQTLIRSPKDFIAKRNIEGEPEFMYTHSYLGNGLMSARQSILLQNYTNHNREVIEHMLTTRDHHHIDVNSPCFQPLGTSQSELWQFNHVHYNLTFKLAGDSFQECYREVARFVLFSQIDKSDELVDREVYAMGYFYDRMKDIRVIKNESGVIKLRDYFHYAENVCNGIIKLRKQNVFLCLDLVYIASYLHDGLGLPLHKDITLVKKINGIETSWALGAAINLFDFK